MSFDLLAEFGSPPPPPGQNRPQQQQPNPARQPGSASFSLFDDLAGLGQPAAPSVSASNSFNTGVSAFPTQGPRLSATPGALPTSTQAETGNDDDWGDFADAAPSAALTTSASINTTSQAQDPWASLRTSTSPAGAKATSGISTSPAPQPIFNSTVSKNDPFDFSAFGVPSRPQSTAAQPKFAAPPATPVPASQPATPRDPNVLFDAENLSEDDDDFGDFEDATPSPAPQQPASAPIATPAPAPVPKPASPPQPKSVPATAQPLNIDALLGELEVSDPLTSVAPTSKQDDWKNSTTAKFAAKTQTSQPAFGATKSPPAPKPATKMAPKVTAAKSSAPKSSMDPPSKPIGQPLGWDDDWDDLIPTNPAPAPAASSSPQPAGFSIPTPSPIPDPAPNSLPPTNVPPPALLLTLFPPIFALAHSSFFKPLGTQPSHVRPKILADQAVVKFLRGYLTVGAVAARIIAGRKLRWKRDTFLAQGMSIGQAGKAGAGGMKLQSIDRTESTKEDREAADVVRAWKDQLGRLRSVVAQVNGKDDRGRSVGSIPELAETMPIRIAKESEGAIASVKPCALCGLKRNERIGKVDVDVEDSFGEWWVEQLSMHRACRNFWEEQKNNLRY
ncbi:hypothetical protein DIS24_g6869 [Lasiodiplodia hormozganensis]|uniref:Serine/threonine-protein kinase ppk6 n=1 Tax=Lasiodiplodia hormozganensis TaxID=869390 RepID=A0AA39YF45_9PEZI|nr:hypothetical protein DIS24_g6869 [Lasiodiplodia hormozganensis]